MLPRFLAAGTVLGQRRRVNPRAAARTPEKKKGWPGSASFPFLLLPSGNLQEQTETQQRNRFYFCFISFVFPICLSSPSNLLHCRSALLWVSFVFSSASVGGSDGCRLSGGRGRGGGRSCQCLKASVWKRRKCFLGTGSSCGGDFSSVVSRDCHY